MCVSTHLLREIEQRREHLSVRRGGVGEAELVEERVGAALKHTIQRNRRKSERKGVSC